MYTYQPRGVCSREIHIDLDGDTIKHVDFVGGCDGNLKAISKLIEGKNIDEVASVLEGNTCGSPLHVGAPISWCKACAQPARLSSAPGQRRLRRSLRRPVQRCAHAVTRSGTSCERARSSHTIDKLPFGKHFSLGSHVAWISAKST